MDPNQKKYSLSLVVPVFNEETLLEEFAADSISELQKVSDDFEIVFVNDGSTDRTGEILRSLELKHNFIKVVHFKKNNGIGVATRTGLKVATKEIIFNNTVDAFFNMKELALFLPHLEKYDVVSGYRTNLKSNNFKGKILTRGNYYLIRLLFQPKLKAYQTVQFFKKYVLDKIQIQAESTFVAPELLIKAHRLDFKIKEIGTEYQRRRAGVGKCGRFKFILGTLKDICRFWFKWNIADKWNSLNHWYRIILVSFFVAFPFISLYFIFYRWTWYDEIADLYNSWAVMAGHQVLYRDTFAILTPLFYYIYAIPQYLFGPSFYIGRAESAIFYFLLLLVVFKLCSRLWGRNTAFLASAFIFLNFYMTQFFVSGVPYALLFLFILGSVYVYSSKMRSPWRLAISAILMTLAVMTRQDMLPVLVILLIWIYFFERDKKLFFLGLGSSLGCAFLIMLPFLLTSARAAVYQTFIYHLSSHLGYGSLLTANGLFNFVFRRYIFSTDILTIYNFVIFLTLAVAVYWIFKYRQAKNKKEYLKNLIGQNKILFLLLFISISLFGIQNIRITFARPHSLYFMFFLSIVLAASLTKIAHQLKMNMDRRIIIIGIVIGIILTTILGLPKLKITTPLRRESDVALMTRGGKAVEKWTTPESKVFSLDPPLFVFLAGRKVFFPLNIGSLLYSEDNDTQAVKNRYEFNLEMVSEWLSGKADVVLIHHSTNPGSDFVDYSDDFNRVVLDALSKNYRLVETVENVYPREYVNAAHTNAVDIYIRK